MMLHQISRPITGNRKTDHRPRRSIFSHRDWLGGGTSAQPDSGTHMLRLEKAEQSLAPQGVGCGFDYEEGRQISSLIQQNLE
jgi:hypothetical protein